MHRWGSGVLQAEPFSFVATEIRIGRGHRRCCYDHCRRNHSPLRQRRIESDADIVAVTAVAGGPFSFAATENRIGYGRLLPRRLLQAEPFSFAATEIRIGRGRLLPRRPLQAEPFLFAATKIRIGRGSSLPRRALQAGHSSLLRRWCCSDSQIHPIKSRITAVQDAFPGKKLHRFASLALKSRIDVGSSPSSARTTSTDPQHIPPARVPSVAPARVLPWMFCMRAGTTQVRQWRQKRVLMRPEAAFPYVFAAEGAQHPPKRPPR